MTDINDWFNSMPPITRHWFAASFVFPILCKFGLFSPFTVILQPNFITTLKLWQPLTSVLYYPLNGNRGFQFLMNLYFLYNYSKRLELGYFYGRQADYVFMLAFNLICLVGLACAFSVVLLMDPMIMSVLYVYCIINQDQIVNFVFGTRFKARYLPWALFGLNFLLGGGGLTDLIGIIVGHLYYFVMMKYPAESGISLLNTPQFLYRLFPGTQAQQTTYGTTPSAAAAAAATSRFPTARPTAAATGTTSSVSHDWGRGRRLED